MNGSKMMAQIARRLARGIPRELFDNVFVSGQRYFDAPDGRFLMIAADNPPASIVLLLAGSALPK